MLNFYSKAFFPIIVVDKLYFRANIKKKFVKYMLMKAYDLKRTQKICYIGDKKMDNLRQCSEKKILRRTKIRRIKTLFMVQSLIL